MEAAMLSATPGHLIADPVLLRAIVGAVDSALTMCDTKVKCVGISSVPWRDPGTITGMIGVHGSVSGFITVNMAEKVATAVVSGLLQDRVSELSAQVVDGVGEVTNIIAGGIKSLLAGTAWGFGQVTVPSVIVGRNYQIAYARGIQYLAVVFEQQDSEALLFEDRLMQVAISLIQI